MEAPFVPSGASLFKNQTGPGTGSWRPGNNIPIIPTICHFVCSELQSYNLVERQLIPRAQSAKISGERRAEEEKRFGGSFLIKMNLSHNWAGPGKSIAFLKPWSTPVSGSLTTAIKPLWDCRKTFPCLHSSGCGKWGFTIETFFFSKRLSLPEGLGLLKILQG